MDERLVLDQVKRLVWEVAFWSPAEVKEIKDGCGFMSTWQIPSVKAFLRAGDGLSSKCHSASGQLNKHHPEECSKSSELRDCGTLIFRSLALTQSNWTLVTLNIDWGQRVLLFRWHYGCLRGRGGYMEYIAASPLRVGDVGNRQH